MNINMLNLQLRVAIAVRVSNFDPFEDICWISIDGIDSMVSEISIKRSAVGISRAALRLAWEAICFALPKATNIRIGMTIEGITVNESYNKVIVDPDSSYSKWTPDLSELMESVGDDIKIDMTSILTDIMKNHGYTPQVVHTNIER